MTNFNNVSYFNKACNVSNAQQVTIEDKACNLQFRLIEEEVGELKEALAIGDIMAVRDAIADILYVTYGMAYIIDVDADKDFDIVHDSNISKLCLTQEEVDATLKHYADMGVAVFAPATELPVAVRVTYTHVVGDKEYSKGKILKNVSWQEPHF